jgi:NDP-sugar pyrophosphorylase family protein
MFDGRFSAGLYRGIDHGKPLISPEARIDEGATIIGPCFIDAAAHVKTDVEIGPYTVLGRGVIVEDGARLANTIVWPNTRIGQNAIIDGPILGRNCHIGRNVSITGTAVIGDKTTLTDYTHL